MGKVLRETSKPSSNSSSPFPSSAPATTSSSSITDTVRGSHQFKISGYSLSKGIGIGKYIASDTFSVGGYEWAIYFYPDGKSVEDNATYVSLFIALASEGTDVRALFELTLLDQSGKERHKINSHFERTLESGPYTLKYRGSMWGYKRFFRRTSLENSEYLKDDCLVMHCTVGVVRTRFEGTKQNVIILQPAMGEDFKALLESEVGCDIVFKVGNESFKAHKLILAARSPVFRAQFFGLVGDPSRDEVVLEDIEPFIFKAMLLFIYTDKFPDIHEVMGSSPVCSQTVMVQHLLVAADLYNLDRLKVLCESVLCEEINTNTVATSLALADQHHCPQLKASCLKFVAHPANLGVVMQSEAFMHLKESCPSLLSELLEAFAVVEDTLSRKRSSSSVYGQDVTDGMAEVSTNPSGRHFKRRM